MVETGRQSCSFSAGLVDLLRDQIDLPMPCMCAHPDTGRAEANMQEEGGRDVTGGGGGGGTEAEEVLFLFFCLTSNE